MSPAANLLLYKVRKSSSGSKGMLSATDEAVATLSVSTISAGFSVLLRPQGNISEITTVCCHLSMIANCQYDIAKQYYCTILSSIPELPFLAEFSSKSLPLAGSCANKAYGMNLFDEVPATHAKFILSRFPR